MIQRFIFNEFLSFWNFQTFRFISLEKKICKPNTTKINTKTKYVGLNYVKRKAKHNLPFEHHQHDFHMPYIYTWKSYLDFYQISSISNCRIYILDNIIVKCVLLHIYIFYYESSNPLYDLFITSFDMPKNAIRQLKTKFESFLQKI